MPRRQDDEFRGPTKTLLGRAVAYHCSRPECERLTICANEAGDGTINIGVASHITAAAPGGPRYDSLLSHEQRRHASNGIWLCQNCGKLVDSDESQYTTDQLREWKKNAETKTRSEVARSHRYQTDLDWSASLDEDDLRQVAQLGLADEDTIDRVIERLNASARRDIDAFMGQTRWPLHPVELGLRTDGIDQPLTTAGLANLLELTRSLSIVSAPGTGKSTTLIQLASTLLDDQRQVGLIVPLAAWAAESVSILKWVTERSAFHGVRVEHLMLLAVHGRLTLLLDGWNELDSKARQRLIFQIDELERDYPLLRLVVSTRRQRTDVPVGGAEVRLDLLSYSQQLEIARARRGQDGEALLDRARRTAGIRDLIAIPLYLNALLAETVGDRLPRTKEEILRLFVENHESSPARAEVLRGELFGRHRSFLQALAVEVMVSTTTLTGETARSIISGVQARLKDEGQIGPLQPAVVLDLLVDHELLVRTGQDSFSFQHSQFQEWHASFEVERLIRSADRDAAVSRRLLEEILNRPIWEEAILFACERMASADAPALEPIGRLILQSLAVDPLFAAEMISRASDLVWEIVKDEVIEFVKRWHAPGRDDRGLRFMTATGRKEFAEEVWLLIANPRNHDGFGVINTTCPFRPSVLGDDWTTRIASLAEEPRVYLLSGIVRECGVDEMEIVTALAKTESSLKVRKAVLQALLMRGATRQVIDLLSIDDPILWHVCAGWVRPGEVTDAAFASRLALEKKQQYERESDPRVKLYLLLESRTADEAVEIEVFELISKGQFASNDDRIGGLVAKAFTSFPQTVANALIQRVRQGSSIDRFEDVLMQCPPVDDEAVTQILLDPKSDHRKAGTVARVAGPEVIGQMVHSFLAFGQKETGAAPSTTRSEAYFEMRDRLGKTRVDLFVEAVLKRQPPPTPEEIEALSYAISLHGLHGDVPTLEGSSSACSALAAVMPHWIEILIGASASTREGMANLAATIGRLGNPTLVPGLLRLLDEDARRQRMAAEANRSRTAGAAVNSDAMTSWSPQYNRALAAIGSAEVVDAMHSRLAVSTAGIQAAQVLSMIWARQSIKPKAHWHAAWPDYSEVARLRTQDQRQAGDVDTSFAAPILAVIRSFDMQAANDTQRLLAVDLVTIALRMPCGDESAVIDAVVALPISARAKTNLLISVTLTGKILNGRTVLAGVEEIVAAAIKEPWLLDQNTGLIERWFEFFPFTDDPELLLRALKLFSPDKVGPWRLRGVIAAICVAPIEGRESLLRTLAEQDSRFYSDDAWLEAILDCATTTTRLRILDDLGEGKLASALKSGNAWRLARDLAKLVKEYPSFRAGIYKELDHLRNEDIRSLLVQLIVKTPDIDGLFVLLRSYATKGWKFDTNLWEVLDSLVMIKRYVSGSNSAYELHAADASILRARLFAALEPNGPLASLAAECLETIDEIRDRHGHIESEPRHPNIVSNRPWPSVAKWVA